MGRILEGFWDCKYCNTTHIGGSVRECPNCGKPRDESTTFYLERPETRYVSKEKAARINRNPDWICPYCDSLNSANYKSCISCGAPRTQENLDYFQNQQKRNQANIPASAYATSSSTAHNNQHNNSTQAHSTSRQRDSFSTHTHTSQLKDLLPAFASTILITLLLVAGIIGLVFLLIPKEHEVTIQSFSWERSISIDRYQTVQESSWILPSGARLQYSQSEFSHYQSVLSHYETKTRQVAKQRISHYEEYVSGYRDLGNGYFEEITSSRPVYETYYETETYEDPVYRDEPVYRTKYYYEIDKWLHERTVKTGDFDQKPYWGETNLKSDEREASRVENYSIAGLNQDDKELTVHLSYEDWISLKIGQTVKMKISLGYGEIVK